MRVKIIATTADDAGEIVRRMAPGAAIKRVFEEDGPVTVDALFTFWCLARATTFQRPSERMNLFALKQSDCKPTASRA